MAYTVNPAVSGVSLGRWLLHAVVFVLGVFAGSLLSLCVVLAVVGAASRVVNAQAVAWVAAGLIVWPVLRDAGLPVPVPYRAKQVPEWLRQAVPPGVVAAAFGFQLGIGFLTRFTYSAHLAMLLTLPFLESWTQVLIALALYALGKTVVILASPLGSPLEELEGRFDARFFFRRHGMPMLRLSTALASICVATVLVLTS